MGHISIQGASLRIARVQEDRPFQNPRAEIPRAERGLRDHLLQSLTIWRNPIKQIDTSCFSGKNFPKCLLLEWEDVAQTPRSCGNPVEVGGRKVVFPCTCRGRKASKLICSPTETDGGGFSKDRKAGGLSNGTSPFCSLGASLRIEFVHTFRYSDVNFLLRCVMRCVGCSGYNNEQTGWSLPSPSLHAASKFDK